MIKLLNVIMTTHNSPDLYHESTHNFMINVLNIIVVLVVMLALLAVFAPKNYHLKRNIIIRKPLNEVFKYLKFIRNQEHWSHQSLALWVF